MSDTTTDKSIELIKQRIDDLEEAIRLIQITQDSYNTEQEVLGEIYLICEDVSQL